MISKITDAERADTEKAFSAWMEYLQHQGKKPVIEVADLGCENWASIHLYPTVRPVWNVAAVKYRLKPEPPKPRDIYVNEHKRPDGTCYCGHLWWDSKDDAEAYGRQKGCCARTVHFRKVEDKP